MKAIEAPEKIYIPTILVANTVRYKEEGSIEYTRTDAFIEKAVSFIRNCTTYDGLGYKAKCVNVEEFKKEMKGE